MKGRVTKATGIWYDVLLDSGQTISCRVKGKQRLVKRRTTNPVVIGDLVSVEKGDTEDALVIDEVLPRNNYIIRQSTRNRTAEHILAANIDLAVLIATITQPRTSTGFIDRFLCTAAAYHIPSAVVFNKIDLLTDDEKDLMHEWTMMYEDAGYKVFHVCALQPESILPLKSFLQKNISLISGHSGVGKSTFINQLIPGLNQKTNAVSGFHEKGLHTTTFTEMFAQPGGGHIIDMPGIKEFGMLDFDLQEVSHFFPEMASIIHDCRFNNCLHINEPGCAVKQAVEEGKIHLRRYENYLSIIGELQTDEKVYDSDK